jgi:hypothetical protein
VSKADLNSEIISRMAQAFPSPIGEAEGLGVVPIPLVDVNNLAGGAGAAGGGGAGAAGGGSAGAAGGGGAGVAGGAGKSKGALGALPFNKLKTVTGSIGTAGKKKASVSLLPGTALTPTSSAKNFFLGKSLIGATAILPGMAAFAGPTGLLPSVTAITAGFGAGVLMPLFLFGTLIAATSHKDRKPRKSKRPPTGGATNKQTQGFQKPQPTNNPAPFNYVGYRVSAKSAPYSKEKPISKRDRNANIDMINPFSSSKAEENVSQHVGFDRRFTLRIKVPPKTLLVRGLLTNGQTFQGFAKDVSMHGVRFSAPKLPIASVKQLVFLHQKTTLDVLQFQLHRQTNSDAVAILTSFVNGPDDWMQWIERITRMDQRF